MLGSTNITQQVFGSSSGVGNIEVIVFGYQNIPLNNVQSAFYDLE